MRYTKCLCQLTVCACFAVDTYVIAKSVAAGCGAFSRPATVYSWCDELLFDLPHNEPVEIPGRSVPNVTFALSSSWTGTTSVYFTLPPSTSM